MVASKSHPSLPHEHDEHAHHDDAVRGPTKNSNASNDRQLPDVPSTMFILYQSLQAEQNHETTANESTSRIKDGLTRREPPCRSPAHSVNANETLIHTIAESPCQTQSNHTQAKLASKSVSWPITMNESRLLPQI